eukprot:CAMPEP_0114338648 /NCGR_PEP_ID=MMETSP0101-20121206/7181_1 /TAXON_ID=38822 ORGANISM="Pteridomonas danica, Strain PT" /NCGR_SAMPLE_ID=MMETSP0101 /ASSEMBLY_ACC=CAM_ASM_000211 /LENGTH=128 /DNA_ID=CAMNT_0001471309 /DNA_START=1720 /DNA_END=2107 /DNA_ORIENTATION=-
MGHGRSAFELEGMLQDKPNRTKNHDDDDDGSDDGNGNNNDKNNNASKNLSQFRNGKHSHYYMNKWRALEASREKKRQMEERAESHESIGGEGVVDMELLVSLQISIITITIIKENGNHGFNNNKKDNH